MQNNQIRIQTKEGSSGAFTEIYVDGCLLKGVRKFELKHNAGDIPTLTVDLSALDIAVDCYRIPIRHETLGELEIKRKVE
jgi:hypothetical protein